MTPETPKTSKPSRGRTDGSHNRRSACGTARDTTNRDGESTLRENAVLIAATACSDRDGSTARRERSLGEAQDRTPGGRTRAGWTRVQLLGRYRLTRRSPGPSAS